jgi:hypothetical protein
VAAAGRANVVARDTQPLVLRRRSHHPLEQLAVAGLEIVLSLQSHARARDPVCKRIADPLKLLQPGDAGLAVGGRDTGIDGDAGKGLGSKAGKLVLEATYLATHLSAREVLVTSYPELPWRFSIEQTRHRSCSSVVDHAEQKKRVPLSNAKLECLPVYCSRKFNGFNRRGPGQKHR